MNPKLKGMIAESLSSVLPITLIVLALSFTIIPVSITTLLLFIMGAAMLIVGMGLFNLGVETAMSPMGEMIGTRLTKFKKPALIACCFFLIGVIVTVAEPDLQVLASQMAAVPDPVIILTVALGVGIFLALAFLRVLFQIPLAPMLIVCYLIVFLLAFFVPGEFLPAAFDSGGVTTGPITVPFILALGVGITAIRVDSAAEDDSFGLVALASIGPILSMMILGLIYGPHHRQLHHPRDPRAGEHPGPLGAVCRRIPRLYPGGRGRAAADHPLFLHLPVALRPAAPPPAHQNPHRHPLCLRGFKPLSHRRQRRLHARRLPDRTGARPL